MIRHSRAVRIIGKSQDGPLHGNMYELGQMV